MSVSVRIGFLHDRVIDDGTEYAVRRGRDGWRYIAGSGGSAGRVRYDGWRDVLSIESPQGTLRIRFRWRNTTFVWRGRTYRMKTSWNGLTVLDGDRPVVEARETWSGLRLEVLVPELRGISRELALGLAHRRAAFAVAMAPAF